VEILERPRKIVLYKNDILWTVQGREHRAYNRDVSRPRSETSNLRTVERGEL
jgi:hypothetical protein